MKKNLFYYAFAVMTALCMTACGDDEETPANNEPKTPTVTLTPPAHADQAVQYKLTTGVTPEEDENAPALTSLEITEGGNILLGFNDPNTGKVSYKSAPVSVNGNTYTLGNNMGYFTKVQPEGARATRAGGIKLILSIQVGNNKYETTAEEPADAVSKAVSETGGAAGAYLARTWNVTGMILDLAGEVTCYAEFSGANLAQVVAKANEHGANISDEDIKDFQKTIKSIEVTKAGTFNIIYTDGTIDAADWMWANNQYDKFSMHLKDGDMGNKFIAEETSVEIAFRDTRCNMTLKTKINDSKKYDVSLILQLQAAN